MSDLLTRKEMDEIFDKEEWSCLEECDVMVIAKAQDAKTKKGLVEWLERHCKGYHKGNYEGEFGHFGIYRSEIEALKKEVEDG